MSVVDYVMSALLHIATVPFALSLGTSSSQLCSDPIGRVMDRDLAAGGNSFYR